jgi:hypothetical protein
MIRNRSLFPALLSCLLLLGAGGAAAQGGTRSLVAGWDFSQYFAPGSLTVDATTEAFTLPANFSDFDPTFGAGAESAAFGTMFIDGSNGSTAVTDEFVPKAGSLGSNLNAPLNEVPLADASFDNHVVLDVEGQPFTELRSMRANASADVVFRADRSGVEAAGDSWQVRFGGQAEGGTSVVGIEFDGGVGFTTMDTVTLAGGDSLFVVDLGSSASDAVAVRFSFQVDGEAGTPVIDNVAITVPEPGAGHATLGVLIPLGLLARRRRSAGGG